MAIRFSKQSVVDSINSISSSDLSPCSNDLKLEAASRRNWAVNFSNSWGFDLAKTIIASKFRRDGVIYGQQLQAWFL